MNTEIFDSPGNHHSVEKYDPIISQKIASLWEKRMNEFLGANIPTAISIINCTDEVSMHDRGSKIIKTKPEWIKSSLAKKRKYQKKYSQSMSWNNNY